MKLILQLMILVPLLLGSSRIIHGTPVLKSEPIYWKTVRLIQPDENRKWVPNCTGIVIATDLILTSAHCVVDWLPRELRVGYEVQPLSYELQSDPKKAINVLKKFKTSRIQNWVIHPQYATVDYDHDLAVVKLEGFVASGFTPLPLLPKHHMDSILMGKEYAVELVGYGMLQQDPWIESTVLRRAQVTAVFEGLHLITDQTQGFGGCHGDSGGPAIMKVNDVSYLVGVTHGPAVGSEGCLQKGVWVNPVLETEFLNKAAEKLGSKARF